MIPLQPAKWSDISRQVLLQKRASLQLHGRAFLMSLILFSHSKHSLVISSLSLSTARFRFLTD